VSALAVVLAKSLAEKKLRLTTVVETARPVLLATLQELVRLSGEAALLPLADAFGLADLLAALGVAALSPADRDAWLQERGLLCLRPSESVALLLGQALKDGKGHDALLALIREHSKNTAADRQLVAQTVAASVFARVAAEGSADASLAALQAELPLLKAVAPSASTQQVLMFALQAALCSAKATKAVTLALFKALYDARVLTPQAVMAWKENTKDKTPGKQQALLAIFKLTTQAEQELPKEPVQAPSDDEDDE
jgi:hypothetical protein